MFNVKDHPRYGGKYKILADDYKMKDPTTREWLDCIVYQQYGDYEKPLTFVREKKEFLSHFIEVN